MFFIFSTDTRELYSICLNTIRIHLPPRPAPHSPPPPSRVPAQVSIKDDMMANNAKTHWVPSFVKEKRFHNWLRDARDWNISRNRYWGTPLPIWTSEDYEEIVVIGSIAELEEATGTKVRRRKEQ